MTTLTPIELLKTIYYGDRGCKCIVVDGWNNQVSLQVTVLSRVRSSTGLWDYYTAEDIPDARLVFTGVHSLRFDPPGPIPSDFINDITVTQISDLHSGKDLFLFQISVGAAVPPSGSTVEVTVEIQAEGLHIEDPARPGVAVE